MSLLRKQCKRRAAFVRDDEKCVGPYDLVPMQATPATPAAPPPMLPPSSSMLSLPDTEDAYATSDAIESSDSSPWRDDDDVEDIAEAVGVSKFDLVSWLIAAGVFVVSASGIMTAINKYREQKEALERMMRRYVMEKQGWQNDLAAKEVELTEIKKKARRISEIYEGKLASSEDEVNRLDNFSKEALRKAEQFYAERNTALGERDRAEAQFNQYRQDRMGEMRTLESRVAEMDALLQRTEEEKKEVEREKAVLRTRVAEMDTALRRTEEEKKEVEMKMNQFKRILERRKKSKPAPQPKPPSQSTARSIPKGGLGMI